MCEHTRFWGPSLTSRDWEKFTYTAHFHMYQLCLAEATTCAVVQCWGFFPAQRQQGFDLPRGCFIATSMAVSLQVFSLFPSLSSNRHCQIAATLLPPAPSHCGGRSRAKPSGPPKSSASLLLPKPTRTGWKSLQRSKAFVYTEKQGGGGGGNLFRKPH